MINKEGGTFSYKIKINPFFIFYFFLSIYIYYRIFFFSYVLSYINRFIFIFLFVGPLCFLYVRYMLIKISLLYSLNITKVGIYIISYYMRRKRVVELLGEPRVARSRDRARFSALFSLLPDVVFWGWGRCGGTFYLLTPYFITVMP